MLCDGRSMQVHATVLLGVITKASSGLIDLAIDHSGSGSVAAAPSLSRAQLEVVLSAHSFTQLFFNFSQRISMFLAAGSFGRSCAQIGNFSRFRKCAQASENMCTFDYIFSCHCILIHCLTIHVERGSRVARNGTAQRCHTPV